ncbi:MAG: HDOD domain-containing protein [Candidatus Electryonea clarkiae]|nr:HDOD domain-containing protein [Candidatus Electryonea clarkiae]MDP8285759.1 HDOD domain-containing protein [Candidatus Electryonea clarkiae]
MEEKTLKQEWENIDARLQGIKNLPVLPTILLKTMRILSNPKSDMNDLHLLLQNDPAITTKIMQVTNSSYYGFTKKIEKLRTSMVMLGMKEVGRLVTSVSLLSGFPRDKISDRFEYSRFWLHSAAVGEVAQAIVQRNNKSDSGELFTAGLLHDIGKLILSSYFTEDFLQCAKLADERNLPLAVAEQKILGVNHMQIGAYMAKKWGLSEMFRDVIRFHHLPALAKKHRMEISIVYLANRICWEYDVDFGSIPGSGRLDEDPIWDSLIENGYLSNKDEAEEIFISASELIEHAKTMTELILL